MPTRICVLCQKVDVLIAEVRSSKCRSCAISIGRTGCGRKNVGNSGGGYRIIYVNRKRIYEHRHVMEQHIGRKLKAREHVHHLDGNRLNNKIENLELIDASEHGRRHLTPEIAKERSRKGIEVRYGKKVS